MKKIKVAHILHSVGGVDVSLRLITEHINTETTESIILHGKSDTKKLFLDKKNKRIKAYKLSIYRNISLVNDLKAIREAVRILKKETPDVIHAHSAKGGVIGKIVGRILNIPVLHTPQAYSYLSATGFKKKVFMFMEKSLKILKNNKILASSSSEFKRAVEEIGYPKDRVMLFNNSIAPIRETKPLSIKKVWPDNYICSVGRPSFQNNIEFMLDVLFELKKDNANVHLVLMGVGYHSPNLDTVKEKILKLNLRKNITMLQWTDREDIFHIIKNSELYISTARYEGLPYSVIESLALGKPLVVTDVDGNRDLVKTHYNGYVINENDIDSFSNSVKKILADDKLKTEYGQNSLKLFNEKFNMHENIINLENIYKETIR